MPLAGFSRACPCLADTKIGSRVRKAKTQAGAKCENPLTKRPSHRGTRAAKNVRHHHPPDGTYHNYHKSQLQKHTVRGGCEGAGTERNNIYNIYIIYIIKIFNTSILPTITHERKRDDDVIVICDNCDTPPRCRFAYEGECEEERKFCDKFFAKRFYFRKICRSFAHTNETRHAS